MHLLDILHQLHGHGTSALQAAPTPPDHWAWKNIYVEPDDIKLRKVTGGYVVPDYDPEYKN